jgi:hypothetical protein
MKGMKKTAIGVATVWMAVVVGLLVPPRLRAQENGQEKETAPAASGDSASASARTPEHFYKLNLIVEEVSEAGKVTNARTYVATISTPGPGTQQIRTGARIPVETGSGQWQYMDVGVNFDVFHPREVDDKLAFSLNAEISSLATPANGTSSSASHPVVRQNRWSSNVVILTGKPTVVFSADDLEDKGKMQVEVMAVRVD